MLPIVTVSSILAQMLLALPPQQGLIGLEIPWWVWLVAIAFVLLVLFLGIVRLDWRSAPPPKEKDEE